MPSQLHGTEKRGNGSDIATISFRIDRERLERVRQVATSNHRSVTAELRWLIDRHIERYDEAAAA